MPLMPMESQVARRFGVRKLGLRPGFGSLMAGFGLLTGLLTTVGGADSSGSNISLKHCKQLGVTAATFAICLRPHLVRTGCMVNTRPYCELSRELQAMSYVCRNHDAASGVLGTAAFTHAMNGVLRMTS